MREILSSNIIRCRKEPAPYSGRYCQPPGRYVPSRHDWYIEDCSEYIFDCNSSGIPHQHAANKLLARNK